MQTPAADHLRTTLTTLVTSTAHDVTDIVIVLSEVIDDYATTYARRTGDYTYATQLLTLARALRVTESRLRGRGGRDLSGPDLKKIITDYHLGEGEE